jgi:hypothetical protein
MMMRNLMIATLAASAIATPVHAVHWTDIDEPAEVKAWYADVVRSDTTPESSGCRALIVHDCVKPKGASEYGPGASCCGEADAYYADKYKVDGDKFYAIITDDRVIEGRPKVAVGTEILIPNKVIDIFRQGNPTGHTIMFLLVDGTFPVCLFPQAEG